MDVDAPRSSGNPTRRWLAIGLAGVLAWVAFLMIAGPTDRSGGLAPPSLQPPGGLARPADFQWSLLDLEDRPVDFARFRGKPILLNLWATWCGPCLAEMPSIAALAANPELKEAGVVILCVSTDNSAEPLRQFLQDKTWGMTILRATSLPPAFQTEGIPATFLIAPDGQVVAAEVGSANWNDPSVVSFLTRMAKPAK